MENTTPFSLDEAVRLWRGNLSQSPEFSAEQIQELESHLLDSVDRLCAAGLSQEEAFLIATRRMGSAHDLKNEYAKENSDRVWLVRAIWMVAGYVLYGMTFRIASIIHNLASRVCGYWIGTALFYLLLCGGIWGLWRFRTSLNQVIRACPIRTIVACFALSSLLNVLSLVGLKWTTHAKTAFELGWAAVMPNPSYFVLFLLLIWLWKRSQKSKPCPLQGTELV